MTVPDEPLRSSDAQTLAPDLHRLETTELVLLKDLNEQGVCDVGGLFFRSKRVLQRQFLDVRSKGKQNQETSHPHVSQVKLLQLLQVAVLVHHAHHGVLQSVQPLLQTHHLVLQALDVLVLERLLDPSVAVSRAAVNIKPQIL